KFTRAPEKPFRKFIAAVERVVSNCITTKEKERGPATRTLSGDARELPVRSKSIDLVLTSPPYLNAIDYLRCSKFSLVWMGHSVDELRQIRGESIGAEASSERALQADWVPSLIKQLGLKPALSDHDRAVLARYVWDMGEALAE